jgi:glutaredoxin
MKHHHVDGKNRKNKVVLYALSTCGWCKKTKALLKELDCEYSYVDVDLLDKTDMEKVDDEVKKWNPAKTYPTIVINDKTCVVGYDPDKIRKNLGE